MAEMVQKIALDGLKLTVKLPRALPIRIWVGSRLIMLACRIIGCGCQIETSVNER